MILYLHGFGSHGNSWKPCLLKESFPEEIVVSDTLPADPVAVEHYFIKVLSVNKPTLLVGSSLGGFYASYLAKKYGISAVIINPALIPWQILKGYIGINVRSETGETFEWHIEYLYTLKKMGETVLNRSLSARHIFFYLARDDELLDHSNIEQVFPDAGGIRYFNNGNHTFFCFKEILPDISELLVSQKNNLPK